MLTSKYKVSRAMVLCMLKGDSACMQLISPFLMQGFFHSSVDSLISFHPITQIMMVPWAVKATVTSSNCWSLANYNAAPKIQYIMLVREAGALSTALLNTDMSAWYCS